VGRSLSRTVLRNPEKGNHVVFDVDVVGGLNIKKQFNQDALAVYIQAPSMEVLESRLRARSTEDEESLQKRLNKVREESAYADKFDVILINDQMDEALKEAEKIVIDFLK